MNPRIAFSSSKGSKMMIHSLTWYHVIFSRFTGKKIIEPSCKKYRIILNYPFWNGPWSWIPNTTFRMLYDVIFVRHQSIPCTVTLVSYTCVKSVRMSISPINSKNTKWCHIKCGNFLQFVQSVQVIPKIYVSFTVENAAYPFVICVQPMMSIKAMKN